MPLPTRDDCKEFLRVEVDDEDSLIARLLASAKARVEGAMGYPMAAAAQSVQDLKRTASWIPTDELELGGPFKTAGPAPIVTDRDGSVVDASCYTLDPKRGKIVAKYWYSFALGPYTITADIGLSAHPDYASQLEAIASSAILQMTAHLYLNRNPGVANEMDEVGGAVSYRVDGIPPAVMQDLMLLPGGERLWLR